MKSLKLVPKERVYMEDVLRFKPINFVANPETGIDDVYMYVETGVSETGKVLYTGNVTLPFDAFSLLTNPLTNFNAINQVLSAFDVTLAKIEPFVPVSTTTVPVAPIESTTTVPVSTTTIPVSTTTVPVSTTTVPK